MKIKKFCVFCGEKPSKKSKEHIIPKWLIKMTGSLNREITVGRNWSDGTLKRRIYSFSSYTFPACSKCNNIFGALEHKAKPILETIICGGDVKVDELNTLLDWFDKIRTGLWLSNIILNKNYGGIIPHYYINDRVCTADRALLVYKNAKEPGGISFIGSDGPMFHSMPSVFGLKINEFYFVSVSTPLMLHREFGLPYPSTHELDSVSEMEIHTFDEGTSEISLPTILKHFPTQCTVIMQSIKINDQLNKNSIEEIYNSSYCTDIFGLTSSTRSKLLISKNGQVQLCEGQNTNVKVESINSPILFSLKLGSYILDYQELLFNKSTIGVEVIGNDVERVSSHVKDIIPIHHLIKKMHKQQVTDLEKEMYANVFANLTSALNGTKTVG